MSEGKVVRLSTPGEILPGDTAQMIARFLHGGDIQAVELDEGIEWIAVLGANKRIESSDGVELTSERLAEVSPVPNRGFAIVVVKNASTTAKVLTGRLVMSETAEIEQKAPALALAVSPAKTEPRVVQIDGASGKPKVEPRVVQIDSSGNVMRSSPRTVGVETRRSGEAQRTIEVQRSAGGSNARRIDTGEGHKMKLKGGATTVTSRRMGTSPTVRQTEAAKAFHAAEAAARAALDA